MSETTKKAQGSSGASGADPLLEPDAELAGSGGRRGRKSQEVRPGKARARLWRRHAQVKQERDDLKDQVLRARAEFANYQKRAKQQADSDRVYAVGSLARDLLDPLDNLERAIEALRASGA